MITERTLKKWRKEALKCKEAISYITAPVGIAQDVHARRDKELYNRILCLTQELLDQHLLKRT